MHLDDLQSFLRVADVGSFTKAASVLGVPKSTVSRRVARLEDALGTQLLLRTTRKLALTAAGRTVVKNASRALQDLERVERLLEDENPKVKGLLRITAPTDLNLAPLLKSFQCAHPDVDIEILVTKRMVDLIEEGYDLALRATAGQLTGDTALMSRKLASVRMVLVASPAYFAGHPVPTSLTELQDHSLVTFPERETTWMLREPTATLAEAPRSVPISVRGRTASSDFLSVRQLTEAGLGIAWLPSHFVHAHLADGRLVEVMPCASISQGAVWMVWPQARHLSPRVRAFVDHAVHIAKTAPLWTECGETTPTDARRDP